MVAEEHDSAPVPSRARSMFSKRPAWAQPVEVQQQTEAASVEIFNRRNLAVEELLKQKEERYQRKIVKAKERERAQLEKEKRKTDPQGTPSDSASKRVRITDETYALYGLESPTKKKEEASAGDIRNGALEEDRRSVQINDAIENGVSTQRRSGRPQRKSQPLPTNIISIDSDDDVPTPVVVPRDSSPPPMDSDEEFPELVAIARERRRKQDAEAKQAQELAAKTAGTAMASVPENDPLIKVLITSPITNTKPLLVYRKLSQRLMEIRQVWCSRQGFTEQEAQTVFLTYKLRRVYDVTTCKSLGIKVDAQGDVVGDKPEDVFQTNTEDGSGGRVHLVAVTEEAFVELKRKRDEEKAAKTKSNFGLEEDDDEETAQTDEQAEHKIRVLIKAKGYSDYKLIVRPNTTCERIVAAFRREKKIDSDKRLVLTFDGEALEPEDQIKDTEVQDMDNLEVYVR